MSSDPRFHAGQRAALADAYMADWTAEAACRADTRPNILGGRGGFVEGMVWERAFMDELSALPPTKEYAWPASVLEVMAVCASCPVRAPCLEAAYDEERRMSRDWYTNELVEDGRRFGVRGGLPGRQRERFEDEPDRLQRSEDWFATVSSRYMWTSDTKAMMTA